MRRWRIYKATGREDDVIAGPDTAGDDVISIADVIDWLRQEAGSLNNAQARAVADELAEVATRDAPPVPRTDDDFTYWSCGVSPSTPAPKETEA